MGGGFYSSTARSARPETIMYANASRAEIFTQKNINNAMSPHGIKLRESRDSKEHPNSLAIILALDVTGSMGSIPHWLVKEGLPNLMDGILKKGEPDPQLLFLGIGDHECDQSPLQVGQFESSDALLDKWLTSVYLEGGGGGNYGESYLLAWYFAAMHTSIDCFEKRKRKGYLFTIGDEPTLKRVPGPTLKQIMGDGQYGNMDANELLEKALKSYEVYHIHTKETGAGSRKETIDGWKQILGDRLLVVENKTQIAETISTVVTSSKATINNASSSSISVDTKTKEDEEIL